MSAGLRPGRCFLLCAACLAMLNTVGEADSFPYRCRNLAANTRDARADSSLVSNFRTSTRVIIRVTLCVEETTRTLSCRRWSCRSLFSDYLLQCAKF
jgi:hypothetical protein